jgi:hypothetical protein
MNVSFLNLSYSRVVVESYFIVKHTLKNKSKGATLIGHFQENSCIN